MSTPKVLTASEVQEVFRYSRIQTVTDKAARGELPGYKVPGTNKWLFPAKEIYEKAGIKEALID